MAKNAIHVNRKVVSVIIINGEPFEYNHHLIHHVTFITNKLSEYYELECDSIIEYFLEGVIQNTLNRIVVVTTNIQSIAIVTRPILVNS